MKEWVLITGATSGIGKAVLEAFAGSDYHLLAIGRDVKKLAELRAAQNSVFTLEIDLSKPLSEKWIVEHIQKLGGKVKYLIHAAATAEPLKSAENVTREGLEKAMNVNVHSAFLLTTALKKTRLYHAEEARVLFFGSDYVTKKMLPHLTSVYAATKAAMDQNVKYLKAEVDGHLLIGYVNPGSTATEGTYRAITKSAQDAGFFGQPPVKPATSDEVAAYVYRLLTQYPSDDFARGQHDFRNRTTNGRASLPAAL